MTEHVGALRFELDLGWTLKTSLDFIYETEIPTQKIEEFKTKQNISLEYVKFLYRIAKAHQACENLKRFN